MSEKLTTEDLKNLTVIIDAKYIATNFFQFI